MILYLLAACGFQNIFLQTQAARKCKIMRATAACRIAISTRKLKKLAHYYYIFVKKGSPLCETRFTLGKEYLYIAMTLWDK